MSEARRVVIASRFHPASVAVFAAADAARERSHGGEQAHENATRVPSFMPRFDAIAHAWRLVRFVHENFRFVAALSSSDEAGRGRARPGRRLRSPAARPVLQ